MKDKGILVAAADDHGHTGNDPKKSSGSSLLPYLIGEVGCLCKIPPAHNLHMQHYCCLRMRLHVLPKPQGLHFCAFHCMHGTVRLLVAHFQ
jgi:hypothetical protein